MSDRASHNQLVSATLAGEVLTRLRAGHAPHGEVRRLIAEGVSAAQATAALRAAHAELARDREQLAQQRTAEVHREVAVAVVAGQPDAAIERKLAARDVDAQVAQMLVQGARAAWQRRQAHGQRQTRVALSVAVALVMLVLGFQVPGFRAGSGAELTAMGAQPSLSAVVVMRPNAMVLAQRLNVRSGPNPGDPIMLQLARDMQLQVIARANDLRRLKVKLPDNREGWVRNDPNVIQLQTPIDSLPIAR